MHHFFDAITNTAGDSLIGYFARVINRTTLAEITLSADDNGTPIVTKSGVENMAKTDVYGNLSLYVEPGTYHLDIYAPNATSFIFRVSDVAMNSSKGDKGDRGEPGPPSPPAGNVESLGDFIVGMRPVIGAGTTRVSTSGATRGDFILDEALSETDRAAYPKAMFRDSINRVFRRDPRDLWIEQFEAVADGVTDSTNAIRAAFAYARFCARKEGAYQSGAPRIRAGIGAFVINGSINIHSTTKFEGEGTGMELGSGATVFIQKQDAYTFIINRADTENGAQAPLDGGADGTEICNMTIRYAGPTTSRGMNSGSAIYAKARVNLHDVIIESFCGPGWQIVATSGGGGIFQGEASASSVRRVSSLACYVGGYLAGADSNVQEVSNCTFGGADTFGLRAEQFLSCTFINNHFKVNGQKFAVTHAGGRYALIPGKEALGSTTAPGTDASVWSLIDNNTAAAGATPWVSGGSYTAGGDAMHINRNARSVFLSNYSESGSGPPVIQFPAFSVGGQWSHAEGCDGDFINGEQGMINARNFFGGSVNTQRGTSMGAGGVSILTPTTPLGYGFKPAGRDFRFSEGNNDVSATMYFTPSATLQTFGRASPVPYMPWMHKGFVMGDRVWDTGAAPPTTGEHAAGERVYNNGGTTPISTTDFWYCSVSGTPGTWVAKA